MAQVKVNEIYLEVETLGDSQNTPLVLIRGLGTQLIDWSPVFLSGLVNAGLYVITFDNRDVGLSQKFDSAYTVSDMAADVIGLLDALQIESAHVFGISMGGMIAQVCAYEHPERLSSMLSVMSSTSRKGLPAPTKAAREAMAAVPDPTGGRQAVIELVAANMKVFGSPGYPESLEHRLKQAAHQYDRAYFPAGVVRQYQAILAGGDRSEMLRQIDLPVTVVHGCDDALIPLACGQDTVDSISGAKFVAIDGMGHNIPDDLSPKLIGIVMTHLECLGESI